VARVNILRRIKTSKGWANVALKKGPDLPVCYETAGSKLKRRCPETLDIAFFVLASSSGIDGTPLSG
jgi:hypothetical protein